MNPSQPTSQHRRDTKNKKPNMKQRAKSSANGHAWNSNAEIMSVLFKSISGG